VREEVAKVLGDQLPIQPAPTNEPALTLPTGTQDQQLLFVPLSLVRSEPAAMRLAIERLNGLSGGGGGDDSSKEDKGGLFGDDGIRLVGATPNWFGAAQDCCGGSPASQPLPVAPFGNRVRYTPDVAGLDLVEKAESASGGEREAVQVAVLDTAPEPADWEWALQHFTHNRHLRETIARLIQPIGEFGPSTLQQALAQALQQLEQNGGFKPIEPAHPFDIRDHGLFVAGIVHATAPWASLRLIRVLNNFGVGSLHTLVIGLCGLLPSRKDGERLVINLSLGILPALEQLGSLWYGLPVEGLPGCPADPSMQFVEGKPAPADKLAEMLKAQDPTVTAPLDALQVPVQRLMEVLQAQNCLVVAAAGNDSVYRGMDRRPRWNPRIPALYDSTLGVAADTVQPVEAARYSNRGEEPAAAVRDAVSTMGGDLAPDGVSPASGVISVYTAEQFPPLLPPSPQPLNHTGWAEWSGTSFATPIMAGIAANTWVTQSGANAALLLSTINIAAHAGNQPDVQGLGVPGVPVRLTWLP
jgi:hypothetical protein